MVKTELPQWLQGLRQTEIVQRLKQDPRTTGGDLLGVPWDTIRNEVVAVGRANFDEPWRHLSPADRALLYAYANQDGHVRELHVALQMLLEDYSLGAPVVIDVGCGPFTAGLALCAVLDPQLEVTYFGVDTSTVMLQLGEELAKKAEDVGNVCRSTRVWTQSLNSVPWERAPSWPPVLVIVSYLLASDTIDPVQLVAELSALLDRIGRGPVLLLCTNSPAEIANRKFPTFRAELENKGFDVVVEEIGEVAIKRGWQDKTRALRYALFHRQEQRTLQL